MYQCLHQATHVLRAEPGLVGRLVPVVIESLVCTVTGKVYFGDEISF
jgi:hypothetical protein